MCSTLAGVFLVVTACTYSWAVCGTGCQKVCRADQRTFWNSSTDKYFTFDDPTMPDINYICDTGASLEDLPRVEAGNTNMYFCTATSKCIGANAGEFTVATDPVSPNNKTASKYYQCTKPAG
jgi:hypothetical protein